MAPRVAPVRQLRPRADRFLKTLAILGRPDIGCGQIEELRASVAIVRDRRIVDR